MRILLIGLIMSVAFIGSASPPTVIDQVGDLVIAVYEDELGFQEVVAFNASSIDVVHLVANNHAEALFEESLVISPAKGGVPTWAECSPLGEYQLGDNAYNKSKKQKFIASTGHEKNLKFVDTYRRARDGLTKS